MNALAREIAELLSAEGPISVARYMALALSHPLHGYYRSRDPLGAAGDFTTAPEISQMFGELLGAWAADIWAHMGEPAPFKLVELGPGRGTLMADALRVMRRVPGMLDAVRLHLVETSEVLREKQRTTLASGPATVWHASFDDVPEGPLILIANEFFDALPIRQYARAADGWHERLVGLGDGGALLFGLAPQVEPSLRMAAPEGAIIEICPEGVALAGSISRRLAAHGGAALMIDYGHARAGFGDTLQAVRRHAFADPLSDPGEADLTAHVDFSALAAAARQAGAAIHGPVTQGAFLRALGIEARAARLKAKATPAQAAGIDAALARLTGEGQSEMGRLFRAMAVANPALGALPGFGPDTA